MRIIAIIIVYIVALGNVLGSKNDNMIEASKIIKALSSEKLSPEDVEKAVFLRSVLLSEVEKDNLMMTHVADFEMILSRKEYAGKYDVICLLGNLGKRSITLVPLLKKIAKTKPALPASKTYHGAIEPALSKILSLPKKSRY